MVPPLSLEATVRQTKGIKNGVIWFLTFSNMEIRS